MALKEFVGGAQPTRLASTLASGGTISFAVDAATGATFPTGATAPFVVVIGRGTDSEEKILVTSRTGDTFSGLSRGYDDTSDVTHPAQSVVEHVLDSETIAEMNGHVNNDALDDHSQYLNAARHDLAARHTFGVAYGSPDAATAVGLVAAAGTGDNPAREDHVHSEKTRVGCTLTCSGHFATDAALTTVTYTTETGDTAGFITVPGSTLTVPAGLGGIYSIDMVVEVADIITDRSYVRVDISSETDLLYHGVVATGGVVGHLGMIVPLAAGETVTSSVFLNVAGVSTTFKARLDLYRLGV